MGQKNSRPLSPHVGIYRRGPHMMVSIIHRATGFILATAGMVTLLWWLASIGGGEESLKHFHTYAITAGDDATIWQTVSNWFFRLMFFGVTYSFFQHFFSGLRHLVMDMGAGYELNTNRTWTWIVFIAAFFATAAVVLFVVSRSLGI
jgi:succinate dehydrogenase / fumarate reductase, cytochrome b subunit